jgi:pimeloyl-ACP methyl ester carboxylesterase
MIPNKILPGAYALISDRPDTETAVIFFHGFLGDAHGTWLNFQSMIESQRANYPEWDRSDLFFVQYPSFRRSISDIAAIALNVVDSVFPVPPPALFETAVRLKGAPEGLLQLNLETHQYKNLILVAHSEGGAVLRRAVEVAYKGNRLHDKLVNAELNLFAPAHLGFEPKGWIGACLNVAKIEQIAITALRLSRAFVEMKEKTTLESTRVNTDRYADESPTYRALRARVLIGADDDIVAHGEFLRDTVLDPEEGQDHTSICKPCPGYPKPLGFAQGKD